MLCCRVRSHDQKKLRDLDRQDVWLMQQVKDPVNSEIITDVGCGLNENRKSCLKLLDMVLNNEVSTVYVPCKDRLTRFGFKILEKVLLMGHPLRSCMQKKTGRHKKNSWMT